ncbi:MAG: formylglycine-generating enzyme family protein [bacterium]|nr:formylglycine-generating enzyme family protein [bacterium]
MRAAVVVLAALIAAACTDSKPAAPTGSKGGTPGSTGGESAEGREDGTPAEPQPKAAQGPRPGEEDFQVYRQAIGDTGVEFEMVPIPGGSFTMGSAADEAGRQEHEGPALEVTVGPFWMGRCEVTWAEYDRWNEDEDRPQAKKPDGVARPTPAYMDMTFNMGREGFPAICMSHIAARQYCKWLSEKTGRFYRLATEAEWEYACRAGTTTPYSCAADQLDEHAWHKGNSPRELERGAAPQPAYHQVGKLAANPWGLHDMHGNVAEWVADHYLADAYAAANGAGPRVRPFFAPPKDKRGRPIRFPHVARGGSWMDDAAMLRSAARQKSEKVWNYQDPQIPKSWWYLTDGQHIGFRIVRPYREPSAAERARFEAL